MDFLQLDDSSYCALCRHMGSLTCLAPAHAGELGAGYHWDLYHLGVSLPSLIGWIELGGMSWERMLLRHSRYA